MRRHGDPSARRWGRAVSDAVAEAFEPPRPLRLLAEDDDDLQIISAALQDAITTVGEIVYEPQGRRLTIALNRFCWECSDAGAARIRAGLQLGGVMGVRSRQVKLDVKSAVVSLMAISFEPSAEAEDPGGYILINLAGGGDLRAKVECIDAVLTDLSEPWVAQAAPAHDV